MTLPSSGTITLADIATELSVSLPIDLNDSNVRALAGVPSGSIVMPTDFYGKSNVDLIPGAIDFNNMVSNTSDGFGIAEATSNTVTITGVSEPISITIDSTDIEANVFALGGGLSTGVSFYVYVNGSYAAGTSWTRTTNGQTTGIAKSLTFSVPNNGTIYVYAILQIDGFSDGDGGTSGTFSVKNASSGNAVLDTFTLSLSATVLTGGGA